ncbi:SGNH/GDSL hydrolase family protein [Mucilaginibacter agri]|uniref:SGNH/GDSL hydrolase family protein n=1 Tax=Mucilaginibacter agri TaxID=2695265 RepID=A0A965ZG81_9SPHI|nr:SGNH/GDSL hydrolase family protein [Mucilaginibacter agri]NCD70473.1 SGNH/GDSL hydrolase family protein [Mucilaginibacter agri]
MKILGSILIALSTVAGCSKQQMDTVNNLPAATASIPATDTATTVTYLALGDSYTIGESVPQAQSFPYQLTGQLKLNKFKASDPVIIAKTGWTTNDLKYAIQAANLNKTFTFVTLLIGVNNQYQNFDINTYRPDFVELLNTAIQFAGGNKRHVFVLSIPDYSVTPFAATSMKQQIADQLNVYNNINQAESDKAGVNYLNITGISRTAATDATLIAGDGLHPSALMYKLWVDQLVKQVASGLNAKP